MNPAILEYYRHETTIDRYLSGDMEYIEHELLCLENPAFNAFSNGAHWLKHNAPSLNPVFYYYHGIIYLNNNQPLFRRIFPHCDHDGYLTEMNDFIRAASALGDCKAYETAVSAIADLIIARSQWFMHKFEKKARNHL